LGSRFESASVGFKPYPCCRYVHPAIDAAIKLCEMGPIPQNLISEVFVSVPPVKSLDYVSRSFPLERATTVDRQFSLSYVVAVALLRGEVVLEDFGERELPPELSALIGRVHIRRQEKPDSETFFLPAVVTVRGASGERSARCERLKGSPSWPMSEEELKAKVRDCLNAGDKPLGGQDFWELMASIEEIDDIREITACWEATQIGTA